MPKSTASFYFAVTDQGQSTLDRRPLEPKIREHFIRSGFRERAGGHFRCRYCDARGLSPTIICKAKLI